MDTTYTIEDINNAILDELGFSVIMTSPTKGYIILGNGLKLSIKYYTNDIKVDLEHLDPITDIMNNTLLVESYITALESSLSVVEIIDRLM